MKRPLRASGWLCMAGVALLASLPGLRTAAAQDKQAASEPLPRIALSELDGTPGANVMMPLYFTRDPKNPLTSITVDIEFVSNNLKFDKIASGTAAEQAGADLSSALTEGKPDDKGVKRSKVRITASLKDAAKGLPDGLLAYLLFEISLDAKPFSIKLTPTVVDAQDNHIPSKKVTGVATESGMVVVQVLDVMPEATCFFFTH